MNSEFITAIKSCPYYNNIFEGHNVVAIWLGGSRCFNCIDERSDYDLTVITLDEKSDYSPDTHITYKGQKVHWYYNSLVDCWDINYRLACIGFTQMAWLGESNLIYVNPQYQEAFQTMLSLKDRLSTAFALKFYKTQAKRCAAIIERGSISESDYSKFIYHLCVVSCLLSGQPLNLDALQRIKRIRWQEVSEEHKAYAVEKLSGLKIYVDSLPVDYEQTVLSELESEIKSVFNIL